MSGVSKTAKRSMTYDRRQESKIYSILLVNGSCDRCARAFKRVEAYSDGNQTWCRNCNVA
jgi:hypothetical protein